MRSIRGQGIRVLTNRFTIEKTEIAPARTITNMKNSEILELYGETLASSLKKGHRDWKLYQDGRSRSFEAWRS
jgi:hypothetical protein